MTAVASPPSLQPRLGWNSGSGVSGALDSMSADDVRMFMPRKSVQRTNSSSSIASSTSSSSTISSSTVQNTGVATANGDGPQWATKKKPARGIWPASKAEPVSGVVPARPQPISAVKSVGQAGQPAHQPSPIVPSQHVQRQQNGVRIANGQNQDSGALLCLLPMNGTFERKQITVPFYPEVLRVGRQTNAKTVPTPLNGYFDSKVLSRQHAEVWADRSGKVFIRDVKSSNGTFVNGQRLSPENRESEPRELREQDILELGIDIVSEDQKEIVHHKVSAKVEFAGVPGNNNTVLDLNFGDIDPSAGVGLLPSPLSQPLGHGRGRPQGMMNGRMSGPPSVAGSQASAVSQQRQLNFWSVPVNVDHVVKVLSNEMKQVRHQNTDLGQTNTFLQSLLSPDEKEKSQSSPRDSHGQRQMNGRPKAPKIDPLVRFSDPPAPPPQQPLPEKPDAKSSPSDMVPNNILKRSDTERPRSSASNSPTNAQSSQILSLVEALSSARKELDTQGSRVKQLEELLQQERTARQSAEERARLLEVGDGAKPNPDTSLKPGETADVVTPIDKSSPSRRNELAKFGPSPGVSSVDATSAEQALQLRLDLLLTEMQEMKQQMEQYRQRAEKAESDAVSTQASLAQMISRLREENGDVAAAAEKAVADGIVSSNADPQSGVKQSSSLAGPTLRPKKNSTSEKRQLSPSAPSALVRSQHPSRISSNLHQALATLLQNDNMDPMNSSELVSQSAPYASMLGVVLLGVGLMAYLNSWQGREK